jgi:hypothetical protein
MMRWFILLLGGKTNKRGGCQRWTSYTSMFSSLMRFSSFARVIAPAVVCVSIISCTITPVTPPSVKARDLPIVHQAAKDSYVRTIQSGSDTFSVQTGSRLFRKTGAPDVDLVGAMHAAEAGYYRQIQAMLAKSDLVLYEGVTDGTRKDPFELPTDEDQKKSGYGRLASALGLIPQHEGIDYRPKSFRNCDLTIQQMQSMLQEEIKRGDQASAGAKSADKELRQVGRMIGGKSWLINGVIGLVGSNTMLRERVRFMLVASGTDADSENMLDARLQRLILEDRNAHVIKELRRIMRRESHHRIAIFYGAGHFPDMQKRLIAMGYQPAGPIRWNTAVTSHPYSCGITGDEVREMLGKKTSD